MQRVNKHVLLSPKSTVKVAPTDRLGGVICSDLKGPITPLDRRSNRYLVNFVVHNTNYCRIFFAKTKDQAAKTLEPFLFTLRNGTIVACICFALMVVANTKVLT